jgi:hypothetical protein
MEKKLYSLYDLSLPAPVSIRTVLIFVGVALPWSALLFFLQVPFSPPWFILYPVLPLAAAYFGNKPIFEGKNLIEYLQSRIKYVFQPNKYKRLEPYTEKPTETYTVNAEVWHLPAKYKQVTIHE